MRSSLSCLMAFPCSRYTSLTFFCTLYLYHEVKRVGRRAHVYRRRMGFIGALGGSIVSCGSYQSLACRSISMPRGALLLLSALLPCDMVSRSLMLE